MRSRSGKSDFHLIRAAVSCSPRIAKYPAVQRKLAAELQQALQGRDLETSPVVDYEEVKSLPYLEAVIHEGLRRHATSSLGLPRLLSEDTVFKGEAFPAGVRSFTRGKIV